MSNSVRTLLFTTAAAMALLWQAHRVEADTLYVSNDTQILTLDASGTQNTFASGLNEPSGMAFGPNGKLYVADNGSDSLFEFAANGQQQTLASGLHSPQGVAVDQSGNVYVGDYNSSSILKFTPQGQQST
ncbi:MAG TPA: SMP-30/gluconolactonase/LRE family protein, partial [Gemmataceae bacterium]|nr:SMP-30/gluconolactonase/LRE family protein [Gemmataceae bacterium]